MQNCLPEIQRRHPRCRAGVGVARAVTLVTIVVLQLLQLQVQSQNPPMSPDSSMPRPSGKPEFVMRLVVDEKLIHKDPQRYERLVFHDPKSGDEDLWVDRLPLLGTGAFRAATVIDSINRSKTRQSLADGTSSQALAYAKLNI